MGFKKGKRNLNQKGGTLQFYGGMKRRKKASTAGDNNDNKPVNDDEGEADANSVTTDPTVPLHELPDLIESDLEEECAYADFEAAFMEAEPLCNDFLARRYTILYLYKVRFKLPPRDQWAGHDGTIAKICKIMGLSGSGGTVVNIRGVLEDILRCQEQGVAYVPMRNCPCMGPQPIVSVDSSEAQIIADCVEDGMSINLTLLLVNKHCTETEQIPLTQSVVNDTIKPLSPKSSTIKKSKQGSRDAASKWARARFRWTKQLMIRLGLLDSDSPEECFCKSKMEPLSMEGIAWWDETHTKCVIGGIGNGLSHFHVIFPRDDDGSN
jgi:hypothetical protein